MSTVHYLAYGSNLHPVRIEARVPSARAIGSVALHGFRLAFHKRSSDLSAKCLIYPDQPVSEKVYAVLYAFDDTEKRYLDQAEGLGHGYFEQQMQVPVNGVDYIAYIYMAKASHIDDELKPYHWYKEMVRLGAAFNGFPDGYVATIAAVQSIDDPDPTRRQKNETILQRMRGN